jgi:hypothetical protein
MEEERPGRRLIGYDPAMRLRLFRNATQRLRYAAPRSRVVAIHLDSLDHGEVSREDLRTLARAAGFPEERLLIPEDGETVEVGASASP